MDGVSVILTYYNGKRFIQEQIDSLCNQTRAFDELLIFDDCSKQEHKDYLERYVRTRTENIKIFYNPKNLGYAGNFLNGCKYANYEIVFLCDQDDLWEPTKIEEMTKIMKVKQDINLLACDIEPFYYSKNAPKWDADNLKTMSDSGVIEFMVPSFSSIHIQRSGSAMCFRKTFFEDIIPFWIDRWAHDDFLWKCALFTNSLAIYHKKLLHRRIHDSNTSELKIRSLQWRIEELQDMINQLEALHNYTSSKLIGSEKNSGIISHNIDGLHERIKFLKGNNPLRWINVATKYKDTFPRIKGLYLDAYLFLFKTYEAK
jgi:glycosyltransferase involved in cell wall biosynthesis